MVWAERQDLPECNPTISSQQVPTGNIFDGLARHNAAFELVPELAESWETSADGLVVTFNLREGVTWHDGVPFTSEDVKFSWEEGIMLYHPTTSVAARSIVSIDTPDANTVVFTHSYANPSFMFQIGAGEGLIIPKHIYENEDIREGPHATCQELPIGTGPFKAEEYIQGERFVMVRNDEWWGRDGTYFDEGGPYLDRIIVAIVPDATARANGFEQGDFGYLYIGHINPPDVARFQAMEGRNIDFQCIGVPPQNLFYINLRDQTMPWAADVRVRQAISWALDREVLNERGSLGLGIPSHTFVLPDHPDYNPDVETYSPRDVAEANRLLDEAGYPRGANGIRFTIRSMTEAFFQDYAFTMAQQLEEVGIEVEVEVLTREALIAKGFVDHDFDTMWGGLGVRDPAVGVSRLYLSTNIGEGSFNNASAYSDPEMDQLWATYSRSVDPDERRTAIFRIQELVQRDLPTITAVLNRLYSAQNTEQFGGFATDCSNQYSLLRTVWSKDGSPTRP